MHRSERKPAKVLRKDPYLCMSDLNACLCHILVLQFFISIVFCERNRIQDIVISHLCDTVGSLPIAPAERH